MAEEANPLHPDLPPDPVESPQDNPVEPTVPEPTPPKKQSSEDYVRGLTGGRYKSTKALAKAKAETDAAYHEEVGRRKALEEQLSMQGGPANPAQPDMDTAIAQRLEEQGIDGSVVGVFKDLIISEIQNTLAPIAEGQKERARIFGDNPQYANDEAAMFEYLNNNPGELEVFNALHAGMPDAAYKYGMRGLAEHSALEATAGVEDSAAELSGELEHSRTHAQVVTQKHRGAAPVGDIKAEEKEKDEAESWAQGVGNRSTDDYMLKRLDFLDDQHPQLAKIKRGEL